MSSGFSWSGGRPKCFVYWQEFQKCYIQTDNPIECQTQGSDYAECLHNQKAIKRGLAIQAEARRQLAHEHAEEKKHSS